jgi:AcrR family transcriptional regulator
VAQDPPTATGSAASDTRSKLVDVAERLFAENGIASVSLRKVGAVAEQRNTSAAQYHFGSKEALLAAIVASRSLPIDARRAALLAEHRGAAAPLPLPRLLTLVVAPLAETIGAAGRRTYYVRFLANLVEQPRSGESWAGVSQGQPALDEVRRQVRLHLPHLSEATFRRRMRWSVLIAFRLLAEHEQQQVEAPCTAPGVGEVVTELVTVLESLLTSPAPHGARVSGAGRARAGR